MLQLHTLGTPRLDGLPEGAHSTPRKQLALLAYLASRSGRGAARTSLTTLLWEDRDEARARQSLRQALLELRKVVGPGLVVTDLRVHLAEGAMATDTEAFELAVGETRWSDAASLWNGDFLATQEEAGGEAFRAWLEAERERLRRLASRAFAETVRASAERGEWSAAAAWAERWVAALPHDTAAHPRLVECLALAGRDAEAASRFAELVSRTRSELGVEPSPEFLAMGDRLAKLGPGPSRRVQPGSAALFSPDFVGRDRQLAELHTLLTREDSTVARVVLEGEPGIGKTRLAEELLRRVVSAARPPVILQVRGRRSTLSAGLEGLRSLLASIHTAPGIAGASGAGLATLAAHAPALRTRFPDLPHPPVPPDTAAALREVLEVVSEERPVLLYLDDAGAIDPATVTLVARATERAGGRVGVLVTTRPGDAPALSESGGAIRLRLQALSEHDLESMLASMLALPPEDRHRLATRVHAASGGNPRHAIEVISALVEEGLIAPAADGTWRAPRGEGWPLPADLREAVALRLERLGAETRSVLDAAAVLRGDLGAQLLRAVTGLPSARVAAAIEELIGRRLLRAPTPDTLEFSHEFTARVAYERLTPDQRTALHVRAASALAATASPDETIPSMVAYHRDLAGLPKSWGRRTRVAALAGAGLLVAVILAVGHRWLGLSPVEGHPRVLVAAFDNRTGVAALDVVGDMAADWVTQGLAQTGLVPVVDLRSARQAETTVRAAGSNISGASSVEERVRALARETGAGTVVWGSFYRSGDTLVVQSRISDATRGEVLRVLDPIRVPLEQPLLAIEQLSSRTAGAFSLMYNRWGSGWVQSTRRPPTFEAYQSFLTGLDLHIQYRYDEALAAYRQALAVDSTYVQPLLWSALAYWSLGRFPEVDSVLRRVERAPDRLGRFDQAMLANAREELRGDWLAARTAAEDMARIAPGSEAWVIVGQEELKLHRPRHALAAFRQADPDRGWLRGWEGYWGFIAGCLHFEGKYREALDAAREARRRFPPSVYQIDYEVRQLAALGMTDSLRARLEESLTLPSGLWARGAVHLDAVQELAAHGHPTEARQILNDALVITADAAGASTAALKLRAELLRLAGRSDELQRLARLLAVSDSTDPAWVGYLGVIAARRNARAAADSADGVLAARVYPYSFGTPELWRARIAALEGDRPRAVALLRQAIKQGLIFDDRLHLDTDLRGLVGFPPYDELMKPVD